MHMRSFLPTALIVVTLTALAGPAQAARPGTPGRLAYVQGDTGGMTPFGVSTSNADGSAATLLRPTCQENVTGVSPRCPSNPAWAPDGKRALFHRNGAGNRVIYSVNLKAADLRLQTRGQAGRIVNVFSPDQQPLH